jgi:hypothetical protein
MRGLDPRIWCRFISQRVNARKRVAFALARLASHNVTVL